MIRGDIRSCCPGNIGPSAKDAVPALTESLKDQDAIVRNAAADAIKKIQATLDEKPKEIR
jgi:HEAT repeat protein